MKYIEIILNKLGYYKVKMPHGSKVEEGDVLEMFGALGEGKYFPRFMRDLCAQDIRLYFQATNDRDRNLIRGAHDRSIYFLSLIQKANDRKKRK